MKISVIIPTLNEEGQVEAAIESARLAGECEIVVSDGGSTDRTLELAAKSDLRVVGSRGRSVQQNAGARAAKGDVLLFLHADCRLQPGAIDAIRNALSDPRCIGGCFRQAIDAPGLKYRLLERGNAARVRLCKWAYGDQGIFVLSKVFQQVGGFPNLELMEDLFLIKQLKRVGKLTLVDTPRLQVSARRWQKNGVLRLTLRNWIWLTLVQCGLSPNRLAKFYAHVR